MWVGYYYDGRGEDGKRKEIPLGTDLDLAKLEWARLDASPAPKTLRKWGDVFDRYEKEIIPGKAPRTQKDNLLSLTQLRKAFSEAPVEALTPQVLAQYRDKRSAKVRANRELSLFSHIFNIAREWGIVTAENPVKGVRKNRETPRDFYARAEVWNAVYGAAPPELRDAMDLAYLTAQRPSDVLIIREADIQDGHLQIAQGKTSKKLRIMLDVDGSPTALGELVARLCEQRRQRGVAGPYLITTPDGRRMTSSMLRIRFDEARSAAAGAALASVLSTAAACVLGLVKLCDKKSGFKFGLCVKAAGIKFSEIAKAGSPSAANNLFQTLRVSAINALLLSYCGSETVAAFTAVNCICAFAESVTSGIPQAASAMLDIQRRA